MTGQPPHLDGHALGLGRLETAIMTVAWHHGGWLTISDIRARLAYHRQVTHTTVGTVTANLHRKDLLTRRTGHTRGAQYKAARPLEEHIGHLIADLLACLSDPGQAPATPSPPGPDTSSWRVGRRLRGRRPPPAVPRRFPQRHLRCRRSRGPRTHRPGRSPS
jgi:predicted transcriptional regulator